MFKNKKCVYEIIISLAVFTISCISIFYTIKDISYEKFSYYQRYFEPTLMQTCGHGFISIIDPELMKPSFEPRGQAVNDFLSLKRVTISCAEVPKPDRIYKDHQIKGWYYISLPIVIIWKLTGPSWSAVNILVVIFGGIAVTFSYLLYRLGMSRWLACTGALLFLIVLENPSYFLFLRDYSKVPYFVGCIFLLGLLVLRPLSNKLLVIVTSFLGVLIGIGYGTRQDILIILPVALITLWFFLPHSLRQWKRNCGLSLLLLLVFITTIIPLNPSFLGGKEIRTNQWHVIELGLSPTFTNFLKVTPSIYDTAYAYNDQLIFLMANDFGYRIEHVATTNLNYDKVTFKLYLNILKTFPADILIRCYAAFNQSFFHQDFYLQNNKYIKALGISGAYLTCVLILLLIGIAQYRLGIYLFLTCAYFFSYPALQFDIRHYYYLIFWFWWPVGFFVNQCIKGLNKNNREKIISNFLKITPFIFFKRIAIFLIVVFLTMLIPLWIARAYQAHQVGELIQTYQQAAVEKISYKFSYKDKMTYVSLKDLFKNTELTSYFMLPEIASVKMLRLNFSSKLCHNKNITLRLNYSSPIDFNVGLEQDMTLVFLDNENQTAQIYLPIYYLKNILVNPVLEIPTEYAPCLTDISELTEMNSYPLWLTLKLAPGWKKIPLYQTLNL